MGRWQNDIKKATVKCRSSMAEPNAFVFPNPADLDVVDVVSEKIMLKSSNILVSLSEIEACLVIAGLYTVKGKQVDDFYKKTIQQLIDKISKVEPIDK